MEISVDEIEKLRKHEREYIKSIFGELIGKSILIKDRWSGQQFKVSVDKVKEIDLPFPRQCIVTIKWLNGKEEQCLGSSFYRRDEDKEILDIKTREIVLTSEAATERQLINFDEGNAMDKFLHEQMVKGSRMPSISRHYEIISVNT